ncbi:hypothetical protein [Pseudaminobacter soli (ex Li et al. 2025)]|nr:hypothetical protein [Mesorhizobium soli]
MTMLDEIVVEKLNKSGLYGSVIEAEAADFLAGMRERFADRI